MVALLICTQLLLSWIAGVELVSVLFVAFCVCHGAKKGVFVAVAFALLRCLVFGTIFSVVILYLVHFSLVGLFFGVAKDWKICKFPFVIVPAVLSTVMFSMLDNVISPLVYGIAFMPYFVASLPVMLTQSVNVAITFLVLFLPVKKAMELTAREG